MKLVKVFIFLLFINKCMAQVMPYDELFFWSEDKILKNRVRKLTGYEFNYSSSVTLADSSESGRKQTEEVFDEKGRIVEKTNFYLFTDVGTRKRRISYDFNSRVDSFYLITSSQLERVETYDWEKDSLKEWSVMEYTMRDEPVTIRKEMTIKRGKRVQLIKLGRKVMQRNFVDHYELDTADIVVLRNAKTGFLIDSVVNYNIKGDTIFKKEIYDLSGLVYKEVHWVKGGVMTKRVVQYQNGLFYSVYYRRIKEELVTYERQIHTIPNLNYTKAFTYSSSGLPIKKEVYRNTDLPEIVVYYKIETY